MTGKLVAIAAAVGGAHALAIRQAGCSFTAHTEGTVSFPVGQHSSGQTRAGSSLNASTLTISNGTLTDAQGRGCWWTPPTTVLQCDVGQIPETGFQIACDGSISFNGQTTFYECQTGEGDIVNIYKLPNQGSNCAEITLAASGCSTSSDCSGNNSSSSQSTTAAQPSTPAASYGQSIAPETTPVPQSETFTPTYSTKKSTTELSTAPVSSLSAKSSTKESTVQVYPTSVKTTTKQSIVPAYSSHIQSTTAAGTMETTVPAYSTSVESSTVPIHSTSMDTTTKQSTVPVYSSSAESKTESIKSTQTEQTTVPVYSTSVQSTTEVMSQTPTTLRQVTTMTSTSAYSSTPTTTTSATSSGVYVPSPSSVTIPTSCPAAGVTNAGEFNLPSLIIVTDKSSPNTANGTQYFADITSQRSTIFNFDIPQSAEGKTCNLVFLFPEKDTLETSSYTFSGSGDLDFSKLSSAAEQSTSYSNAPSAESDHGQQTVQPGNYYNITSFSCPSGTTYTAEISAVSGGDTSLYYFQDYNPCPIGLFITTS